MRWIYKEFIVMYIVGRERYLPFGASSRAGDFGSFHYLPLFCRVFLHLFFCLKKNRNKSYPLHIFKLS